MWVHYVTKGEKNNPPWERHEVLMTKGYLKTRFGKVDGKKNYTEEVIISSIKT